MEKEIFDPQVSKGYFIVLIASTTKINSLLTLKKISSNVGTVDMQVGRFIALFAVLALLQTSKLGERFQTMLTFPFLMNCSMRKNMKR